MTPGRRRGDRRPIPATARLTPSDRAVAALVGSADQVLSKLEAYQKMGMRAFILSGYPHIDEAQHFGARVLPQMKTCSLPHEYGRVPDHVPATPLGVGARR